MPTIYLMLLWPDSPSVFNTEYSLLTASSDSPITVARFFIKPLLFQQRVRSGDMPQQKLTYQLLDSISHTQQRPLPNIRVSPSICTTPIRLIHVEVMPEQPVKRLEEVLKSADAIIQRLVTADVTAVAHKHAENEQVAAGDAFDRRCVQSKSSSAFVGIGAVVEEPAEEVNVLGHCSFAVCDQHNDKPFNLLLGDYTL